MKILIFYNTAWYIYNFRQNLIRALQENGHTVCAISPYDEYVPRLKALGVEHYSLTLRPRSVNPFSEIFTLCELYRLLRSANPDIVFSFTIKCNIYAGLLKQLLGFRQVSNVSGLGEVFDRAGVVNSIVRLLYKISIGKTDRVFFQNREDLEMCVREKLVPEKIAQMIPGSGVDLVKFAPTGEIPRKIATRFLMLGRLVPKKGYDEFLLAAKELRGKYGDKVECIILGMRDENRAESIELHSRIVSASEAGHIQILQPTDNVLPIVQSADVVVLPSCYNEGIPRSLLEAMACGKAVITTDWKGCRETVREGENGFLVPVGDVRALTDAMEKMIISSDEKLFEYGARSRQLAEERFDERKVIGAYLGEIGQ